MKLLIVFIVFFDVFCYANTSYITPEELKEYEVSDLYADQVTDAFAEKMRREKKLFAIGSGGGGPGKLRMLSVSFECFKKVDIAQARLLLIENVEAFLKEINAKNELKPYLKNVPFTPNNVDITIFFYQNKTRSLLTPPYLAVAQAKEGKLGYIVDSDEHLEFVKKETYEEAMMTIEQEKLQKQ